MAISFRDFPINFIWIILFVIAIGGFITTLAVNNDQDPSSFTDGQINFTNYEAQLNRQGETLGVVQENTLQDDLTQEQGNLFFTGIWGSIKQFWSITGSGWQLVTGTVNKVLGIPPIVTSALFIVAVITMVLLAWRTLKLGE